MKAARLHSYGDEHLRIDEISEPEVQGYHDVIVRIGAAGLCRTDLHIIEGVLADVFAPQLPYTLGHESAGWVAAVGDAVTSVAEGDAVIVHPLITCGACPGCRRGEDMYCSDSAFPGATVDGGFAHYLRTSDRACIKLADGLAPADVAAHADAGITAYRAAKRASARLSPGTRCVVVGVGGLGHIAVQILKTMCPAEVIAVDTSDAALNLAAAVGADHTVKADEGVVEAVRELCKGQGAQAVLDFVGEHETPQQGPAMLAQGGSYYVVGYGGTLDLPLASMVLGEINVVGNLVGSYTELSELMALVADGTVTLHTTSYPLDEINNAIDDFSGGRIQGRAVIVPSAV